MEKVQVVDVPEMDVAIVCRDFMSFCNYVMERKVKLSKTTGHIGKKDCFELNSLFHKKEKYEKVGHFQKQYPIIHFFYYVAIKYKILEVNPSGTVLICGRNYAVYQKASVMEQYLLFVLNLMFDGQFAGGNDYGRIYVERFWDWALDDQRTAGTVCELPGFVVGVISETNNGLISYLEELCFARILESGKRETGFCWKIEILPLLEMVIDLYNTYFFEEEVYWDKDEMIERYFASYLDSVLTEGKEYPLLQLFEPSGGDYQNKVIDLEVRIRYHNSIRVIRMNLSDSMYKLHNMIQHAFEFDNDHIFEFYVGLGDFRKTYTIPTLGTELSVEDTNLGELELYKGQKFSYLFDFGDMWWFDIKVLQIAEGEVPEPMIIRSEFDAPEQYPYNDEFEGYYSEIDKKMTVTDILADIEDELIEIEYMALCGIRVQDSQEKLSVERKRLFIEQMVLGEPEKMLLFMTKEIQEMLYRLLQEECFDSDELCTVARLYSFGFCTFPEDGGDEIRVPEAVKTAYKMQTKKIEQYNRLTDVSKQLLNRCGVMEMDQLYKVAVKFVRTDITYEEYDFMIYSRLHYLGDYFSSNFSDKEFMSCYNESITERILSERQKPENAESGYPVFKNMSHKKLSEKSEVLRKWEEYVKCNLTIDWKTTSWLIRQIPALAASGVVSRDQITTKYKETIHNAGSRMSKKAEGLIAELCTKLPLATKRGVASVEQKEYRQMTFFDSVDSI